MNDKKHMAQAIKAAEHGLGRVSPHPLVGAVIVRDGAIIAEGHHILSQIDHAETVALRRAGDRAKGATLYVTLEPCNHHGRTPPCTQKIIDAGIARVVYAVPDPNPKAAGGHRRMAAAGVEVVAGVLAEVSAEQNRFFLHHITTGRPYIIAKFAASLDGKIATRSGDSKWISSPESRLRSHELRQAVDAILIGAGTAIADNPSLTTRLPDIDKPSHPLRVVLDSSGRVPLTSRLFSGELPGQTLVATTRSMSAAHKQALQAQGVRVMVCGEKRVDVDILVRGLGRDNITSLLIEGGAQIHGSFFDAALVNELWAFIAPMLIGGTDAPAAIGGFGPTALSNAHQLQNHKVETLGCDILVRGKINSIRDTFLDSPPSHLEKAL